MENNTIYINGNIITMDDEQPKAEAIYVKGDSFYRVGSVKEVMSYSDDNTRVIDLKNQTVLPGMNDSHMHLISYALSTKKVDLRHCKSLEDIKNSINEYLKKDEFFFGDWIVGHGWNDEDFKDRGYPIAEFLDEICRDRPIYLSRACYHIAAVNTKALELANINRKTLDPDGGKIDRDNAGNPTGILRENALLLAYNTIPMPKDIKQIKELIKAGINDALKMGLTSIQTDDFKHVGGYEKVLKAYKELEKEGELDLRLNLQMLLYLEELEGFLKLGIITGEGSNILKYGPLKVLADGSLGGKTAALENPYEEDEDNYGILIYESEKLEALLKLASDNGLQLAVHAIGDGAMNQLLTIYDKLYKNKKQHRARLIHCQITNPKIISKMKNLEVIADIQPSFLMTDMKMLFDRIGEGRAKDSYSWKSMLKNGVVVAGGSDSPIESFNPFLGIYAAVTRKDMEEKPEGGWYPEESLTLEEAIKIYTVGSSYASFEENYKGKIKEGHLADFIVLDRDISKISPLDIKNIKVKATYVGGVEKYRG
ncbi:amidohydrolase [Alkaliphilus pronyensis]|uniref:Amidohydrolase n=1 Tax=Alkaliphilus pronyensis TaxID=1482732 RepID=A0A6I0FIJ9_9FIRM|nr:amidohydrolase [Alkaliphilus pronyensis]KAB3539066.1 amidohydrolase [Alkaliphilus pronyensis]